ncbi:Hypothetical predicted protein [Podarcis lilfordi]|uniref:Uncharacterized protein n=1 Tax=Podarcis lilfordi TaxID=74358 RepID=A0AA35KMK9_9SAUR|nr:Hypothetical predicted protein [Podarcis lilfordi]
MAVPQKVKIIPDIGHSHFIDVKQKKGTESPTQENHDAEQNGNEGSCAKTRWKEQSFSIARLHVPSAVTGAHPDSQCASAALDGVVIVKYYHWQDIGAHFIPAVSIPSCYDACCVI